jgi:hypothetical protein
VVYAWVLEENLEFLIKVKKVLQLYSSVFFDGHGYFPSDLQCVIQAF